MPVPGVPTATLSAHVKSHSSQGELESLEWGWDVAMAHSNEWTADDPFPFAVPTEVYVTPRIIVGPFHNIGYTKRTLAAYEPTGTAERNVEVDFGLPAILHKTDAA